MILNLGEFQPGHGIIYCPWATFSSDDPAASIAIADLVLADIRVYKDGSITQRTSTAGFALLDTDGIDFDAIVGIGGVSIDINDNTDSGFYAPGSDYWIVITPVSVDAGGINFIPGIFSIANRGPQGLGIVFNTAKAGTLSTTEMSTNLTEATNGHYIDRTVLWTSGALKDTAKRITGYVGTNGVLTYDPAVGAPSAGDHFMVV